MRPLLLCERAVSPAEQFVSEPLLPATGTADPTAMARGEPGLARRFTWRGREYQVVRILQQWKSSGPCRSGSSEIYLRRHWYKLLVEPPLVMTVYCERQARQSRRPKTRWWIYTVQPIE